MFMTGVLCTVCGAQVYLKLSICNMFSFSKGQRYTSPVYVIFIYRKINDI